jgi:hypothetical protein
MADEGLKARVDRLLNEDIRSEDLTRLFLYARDRCDGREPVQEIGDFVAHHAERTKGIVTRETSDWFITSRIMFSGVQKPLDRSKLPPNFREFLSASLRRIGPVIKRSGFSQSRARKMLPGILGKFDTNPDGTLAVSKKHTDDEVKLINALSSYIVSRPAFLADRLFNDFAETLKKNGLLDKKKMNEFKKVKPAVLLFAVTVMHNCVVQIGDGLTCKLIAAPTGPNGSIDVIAPVPTIENPGIFAASPIFSTDLPVRECCEDALVAAPQPWDFDLEITSAQKLTKLG